MPSITSWVRLEPRSRNAEMSASLQARIYDPLWLLARQWQLGEFQGEDNGSPVVARWRAESARLTRYHAGAIAPNSRVDAPSYELGMPLEALVEREAARPANPPAPLEKLRLAVDAGQQFLRMLEHMRARGVLTRDYRSAFVRQYAFSAPTLEERASLDPDTRSFLDLMGPRVPDGRRLYADFKPSTGDVQVLPALTIAQGDVAEIREAARQWLTWLEAFFSEPERGAASWLPERLEYSFSVGTRSSDGERVLTAPEYSEGHLDWYAFDANPEVTLGAATDKPPTEVVRTAIPAPVSFRGMPAARFWEFEDAQVDFGAVDAGPTDLLRMLLVEFALAYGNDWFVLPVELDIGAIYRTRSLVITDTFGVRTLIQPSSELPAPHASWRMFQHSHLRGSGLGPAANVFFLTPALLQSLESKPVEEVLFMRDEMANMAWAIERVLESPTEQPLNQFEADLRRQELDAPRATPATPAEILRYRLSTETPAYWVPLLPVRTEDGLRLRRGSVLDTMGGSAPVQARGRILDTGQQLSLFEEEVPREGVRVTRSYQFTRWIDGSSHLWLSRRKGAGRGEGSSGLRFDALDPAQLDSEQMPS